MMMMKPNVFNKQLKFKQNQDEDQQALLAKDKSTYSTNDVMNMTFNRSSNAIPGGMFL